MWKDILKIIVILLFILSSCEIKKEEKKEIIIVSTEKKYIPNDSIVISDQIRKNESFYNLLQGHIAHSEILNLYNKSLKNTFSLKNIRKGQSYKIIYRDSQFYKFEYKINSRSYFEILRNDSINF